MGSISIPALPRKLKQHPDIQESIIHTGQHHDNQMSAVFFDELDIPPSAQSLNIQGGPHGQMTGRMLEAIEAMLIEQPTDAVLVYGDANSTVAGVLAAAKLQLPVIHVQAGLRSFNQQMPEEINRVLTDHISQLLLCPTQTAVNNLAHEGITDGVHLVGDTSMMLAYTHSTRSNNTLN